jgi:hypothetical protein
MTVHVPGNFGKGRLPILWRVLPTLPKIVANVGTLCTYDKRTNHSSLLLVRQEPHPNGRYGCCRAQHSERNGIRVALVLAFFLMMRSGSLA